LKTTKSEPPDNVQGKLEDIKRNNHKPKSKKGRKNNDMQKKETK
jgi:hypothetical protein